MYQSRATVVGSATVSLYIKELHNPLYEERPSGISLHNDGTNMDSGSCSNTLPATLSAPDYTAGPQPDAQYATVNELKHTDQTPIHYENIIRDTTTSLPGAFHSTAETHGSRIKRPMTIHAEVHYETINLHPAATLMESNTDYMHPHYLSTSAPIAPPSHLSTDL